MSLETIKNIQIMRLIKIYNYQNGMVIQYNYFILKFRNINPDLRIYIRV